MRMKNLFSQKFFRLLSEKSQREVFVLELTEAVEELANHLADFSLNEQDYRCESNIRFSSRIEKTTFQLHHSTQQTKPISLKLWN